MICWGKFFPVFVLASKASPVPGKAPYTASIYNGYNVPIQYLYIEATPCSQFIHRESTGFFMKRKIGMNTENAVDKRFKKHTLLGTTCVYSGADPATL